MKHNNVIPNGHFHKDWQRWVKTWFDQPAKKLARRRARKLKAAKIAPRPTDLLRPAVRCSSIRYNMRIRHGRGFSLAELKAAKIVRQQALTIGIPIDHRRSNKSEETFQKNVARLKAYKARLILFPVRSAAKKARKAEKEAKGKKGSKKGEKKGEKKVEKKKRASSTPRELLQKARQVKVDAVLPLVFKPERIIRTRRMKAWEKNPDRSVYQILRKGRIGRKLKKRKEAKKEAKAGKGGKSAKKKKADAEEEMGEAES